MKVGAWAARILLNVTNGGGRAGSLVGSMALEEPDANGVVAPFAVRAGEPLTVRVLVDHTIMEVFVMGGRVAHTSRIFDTTQGAAEVTAVDVSGKGAAVQLVAMDVFDMAEATPDPELEALAEQYRQDRGL